MASEGQRQTRRYLAVCYVHLKFSTFCQYVSFAFESGMKKFTFSVIGAFLRQAFAVLYFVHLVSMFQLVD